MDGRLIASSCIPNPDQQVWEILIPLKSDTDSSKHKKDDVEEMIEEGED